MCGEAIEVPERMPKVGSSPGALCVAARIATPGAAMSGLRTSVPSARTGPRLEKPAICGVGVVTPVVFSPTRVIGRSTPPCT